MRGLTARTRTIALTVTIACVLPLAAIPAGAGEFEISRYIEPNQMSNLFTRHVRKGIIKRIGLTEAQLYEIKQTVDPHREQLLAQMTELKDARIELVEAVAAEPFDPKRVGSAHSNAMLHELDLMLTVGVVISEIRPILTEEQRGEVAEMMEEIRESSEVRFADFSKKLAAGALLGLKDRSDSGK